MQSQHEYNDLVRDGIAAQLALRWVQLQTW